LRQPQLRVAVDLRAGVKRVALDARRVPKRLLAASPCPVGSCVCWALGPGCRIGRGQWAWGWDLPFWQQALQDGPGQA